MPRKNRPSHLTLEQSFEWFGFAVDPETGCHVWRGPIDVHGYGRIRWGAKTYRAHRVAFVIANGPIPEGVGLDHQCRNRACVNAKHLRHATVKQNAENVAGHGASGVRGVTWDKRRGKWSAQVGHNGRKYNLGRFTRLEDAAEAARAKRAELFTHSLT